MILDINKVIAKLPEKVREWRIIKTVDIPFRQYVVESCQQNRCGMYGKNWQCPPGVGTLENLQRECLSYKEALVFTTCYQLTDSFDIDGMTKARTMHEQTTDFVIGLFGMDKIKALSAEGCDLCVECAYPNAPCRYPQKARPSVEAYGISVVELAKDCGLRYNNGEKTVTYFSLVLY